MHFELSAEQQRLQQTVVEFCTRECRPELEVMLEQSGVFPEELYQKLVHAGFFGISFPAEHGGGGGNILDVVLVTEQLARFSYTAVNMYLVNAIFAGMILLNCGSDAQKIEFIPKLLTGELKFSFALTEPDAGSDARSIKTVALEKGDCFHITGTKYWTTSATVADYIITVALTGKDADPSKVMSVFIVPTKSEGLKITPIRKLAGNAFPSCKVNYLGVPVSKENVLGGMEWLNGGLIQLLKAADLERICVAAGCVGGADTILEECKEFSRIRQQFNKPIIKFQAIQHALADMATQVEAMR